MNKTCDIKEKNTLFPVFLKIDHLDTLVVGGGAVGLEKLNALLANAPDAKVTLVGINILPRIKALAKKAPRVQLAERAFDSGDLYGKDLAIIATDNPEQNAQIHGIAKAMRVLVNVADTPDLCDFYLGSIVQKGNLKIAISTNGKSPTMAKRLRQVLAEIIPDEMEEVLHNLRSIREKLKGDFSKKVSRLNEITSVLVDKNN